MVAPPVTSTALSARVGDELDPRRVIGVAQGHAFEVGGRVYANTFGTTARLMLSVDGRIVIDIDDAPVRGGTRSGTFVNARGVPRDVQLTWGPPEGFACPVVVRVDDEVVFKRTIGVMGWRVIFGALAFGVIGALVTLAVLSVAFGWIFEPWR